MKLPKDMEEVNGGIVVTVYKIYFGLGEDMPRTSVLTRCPWIKAATIKAELMGLAVYFLLENLQQPLSHHLGSLVEGES